MESGIFCDIIYAINDLLGGSPLNTIGCPSVAGTSTFFALFVLIFGVIGLLAG